MALTSHHANYGSHAPLWLNIFIIWHENQLKLCSVDKNKVQVMPTYMYARTIIIMAEWLPQRGRPRYGL